MSEYTQRWSERRGSWRSVHEGGFDRRRYEVAPVAETEARAFVSRHHYSGSYPASRLRYGLYESRGPLVGVAVLSVPVRAAVLTSVFPSLTPYRESLELGRFVLLDRVPANAESWFLGHLFRLAERDGLRGVVSFSDPVARTRADGTVVFAGHVGTIYQATNAEYLGRSRPRWVWLLPDGTVFSERAITKIRSQSRGHDYAERQLVRWGSPAREWKDEPESWLAEALLQAGVRRVRHSGCYRYGFALGSPNERRILRREWSCAAYPKVTAGVAS